METPKSDPQELLEQEVEQARSGLGTYVWVGQKYYIDFEDIPPNFGTREYDMPHRRKLAKRIESDINGRAYPLSPIDPSNPEDDNVRVKYGKVYVRILEGIDPQTGENITSWVNFNQEPQKPQRGRWPKKIKRS